MNTQQTLNFPEATGSELRDRGIKQSVDNANALYEAWSDQAYKFCKDYINFHNQFMVEEIRYAAVGFISDPPSKRAWAGPIMRLAREGYIMRIGYSNTTNPKSHATPATVWVKK